MIDLALWGIPILVMGYCLLEAQLSRKSVNKAFPLVDARLSWLPRAMLSLRFALNGTKVLQDGYKQYKNRAFQVLRNDGNIVVLPSEVLSELSSLPPSIADPHAALEHDLLGSYTGLDLILESRMHHSIVQRKLTHGLAGLTQPLEQELVAAIQDNFPACSEWTEFKPYAVLARISARLSARALVGPKLCRNEAWLNLSVDYVENLFRTIAILRLLPSWTHPFISRLLPSYWKSHSYIRSAKTLLGPRIEHLLQQGDAGKWTPSEHDNNVLAWLADAAKGRDRNASTLAHIEVLLALASVHTTLLRMVNVLYDLTAHPTSIPALREEIAQTRQHTWTPQSYASLTKLDSALRESQRITPPTTLGMKRIFHAPHTFHNGIHLPAGTYACMATHAIENDAAHTPAPEHFDALRSWRARQEDASDPTPTRDQQHTFTSPEPTALNFGFGKSACPGRFFAQLMLKMVFVKLLSEYEFAFVGAGPNATEEVLAKCRPQSMQVHEFVFPQPWARMRVRRRRGGDAQLGAPF